MPGTGSGDLFGALQEFFDACLLALEDTPDGPPPCAYISAGPPAYDQAECLIVHLAGPFVGDTFPLHPALAPLHRATTHGQVNLVTFTATILRCAVLLDGDQPQDLPSPAHHAATAAQCCADLWSIWNHLLYRKRAETLFAPREREMGLDPPVPYNQGGSVGWQIPVRIELDGYRPADVSAS